MITDFTIDLETFGTGHNAVIVGIGLAGFNLETGVITPMLDLTVDPTSCMDAGLKADGDTILWWMRQSDAARAKINTNRITLQEALFEVIDHMRGEGVKLDDKGNSDARVWGNGIRADNVWLASAFAAIGIPAPWGFRNDRDVRTIRDLAVSLGCEDFKETLEFSGVRHCALDDAVHQAKYVCSYYRVLREPENRSQKLSEGGGVMGLFVKKPIVVEAFQMTKERRQDNSEWPEWLHKAWQKDYYEEGALSCIDFPNSGGTDQLQIKTLEGMHRVSWGDFIIQGVNGELYPCKPEIFEKTYDPAL